MSQRQNKVKDIDVLQQDFAVITLERGSYSRSPPGIMSRLEITIRTLIMSEQVDHISFLKYLLLLLLLTLKHRRSFILMLFKLKLNIINLKMLFMEYCWLWNMTSSCWVQWPDTCSLSGCYSITALHLQHGIRPLADFYDSVQKEKVLIIQYKQQQNECICVPPPHEVIAWNYQGQFKALHEFSFKWWFEEIFKCNDTYNFSAAIKNKETKEGRTLDLRIHCKFEIIGIICICYK